MAPDLDDALLPERTAADLSSSSSDDDEIDEDEDDEEEEDDVEIDDDDVIDSTPVSSAAPPAAAVTVAALPSPPADTTPRTVQYEAVILPATAEPAENRKPAAAIDDSRRLFQRLWTDEDEIELLQGFLDYTKQRGSCGRGGGGGGGGQNDTALFYDQIKPKLQLEFNKSQLVEKLRRLKKKYRNVVGKLAAGKDVSFKSPHDHATFEISKKIWSEDNALIDDNVNFNHFEVKTEEAGALQMSTPRPRKRQRPPPQPKTTAFVEPISAVKENHNNVSNGGVVSGSYCGNCNVQGMIEETVKSCMSPIFRELMSNLIAVGGGQARGFGGLSLNPIPLSFGGPLMNLNYGGGEVAVEQWRKQQILELEVYSKRLELVQSRIKVALDELRSTTEGD